MTRPMATRSACSSAPPRAASTCHQSGSSASVRPAEPEGGHDPAHPVPPRYPIKCDLCDGLPYMGCVHACPTGAAVRVDPRTLLKETGLVSIGTRIKKAEAV